MVHTPSSTAESEAGRMRILLVGAGGVGAAAARLAASRPFVESVVVADVDPARAQSVAAQAAGDRFAGVDLDAGDSAAVARCASDHRVDVVLNACDPRFVMPLFDAAASAGCTYVDMAMSLSSPHPQRPHELTGVKLGDEQFAAHDAWAEAGRLAIVGMGVEPGLSDVFARYAADHLFDVVDEVGVRDGADLVVDGYEFAPTFSIWTTIEECLNPPVVYEKERGWYTTAPFSEPEVFDFPDGIGPVECVNVEHEEVLLVPRYLDVRRVTFKYGLGEEFIEILRTLHKLGLDSTRPVDVRGTRVSPRDVVAACLPNPATLGDRMRGRTCAGTWVKGTGKDGRPREVYLYHVVDNEQSMRDWGAQAVVWQTAINPIIALELLDSGAWSGAGVLGPEAFDAAPFLELLADYGAPHAMREEQPRGG
jgi:saccharopine dehydrogenase-like NADP-dependent oxidoreductase